MNIDGKQIGDKILETEEKLVKLENGCLCCTLGADLFDETLALALEGKCDYPIIEASGVSELLPIAATFTFPMDDGKSLKDVVHLDTMVTVVDAFNFIDQYESDEMEIQERKTRVQTHDQTSVVELMIGQLEFANVILVNKAELVSPETLDKVHQMVRAINAEAKCIDADTSHSHGEGLVHSHSHELRLTAFAYRTRKPFVPERLIQFMGTPTPGLIRCKAYFWLCTRMDQAGNFQLAGKLVDYGEAGHWYSTIPEEDWPPDMREFIEQEWVEPFGDRRQESSSLAATMRSIKSRSSAPSMHA